MRNLYDKKDLSNVPCSLSLEDTNENTPDANTEPQKKSLYSNYQMLKAADPKSRFWEYAENELEQMEGVFESYPLETREQAMTGELRENAYADVFGRYRGLAGDIIRFRKVHPDFDERDNFYKKGAVLVPRLRKALKRRRLTFEFARDLAEAQKCYGFIISFILDDGDTLVAARAGTRRGKDAHEIADQKKRFVAGMLVKYHDRGDYSKLAADKVARDIAKFITKGVFPPDFNANWFESLIFRKGASVTLIPVYQRNNMTKKKARGFAELPTDDLPSISAPRQPAS